MTKYRRATHKLLFFWQYRAANFAFYGIIPQILDRVWLVFETWPRVGPFETRAITLMVNGFEIIIIINMLYSTTVESTVVYH